MMSPGLASSMRRRRPSATVACVYPDDDSLESLVSSESTSELVAGSCDEPPLRLRSEPPTVHNFTTAVPRVASERPICNGASRDTCRAADSGALAGSTAAAARPSRDAYSTDLMHHRA